MAYGSWHYLWSTLVEDWEEGETTEGAEELASFFLWTPGESRFFPESLDQFFLPKSIMELPATQQE